MNWLRIRHRCRAKYGLTKDIFWWRAMTLAESMLVLHEYLS